MSHKSQPAGRRRRLRCNRTLDSLRRCRRERHYVDCLCRMNSSQTHGTMQTQRETEGDWRKHKQTRRNRNRCIDLIARPTVVLQAHVDRHRTFDCRALATRCSAAPVARSTLSRSNTWISRAVNSDVSKAYLEMRKMERWRRRVHMHIRCIFSKMFRAQPRPSLLMPLRFYLYIFIHQKQR